ncbi:hypothetical protein SNEBB_006984 [Seison nebaliae]|nr:hypothetical protein SNEBB_006984 [Seison nebaliae]
MVTIDELYNCHRELCEIDESDSERNKFKSYYETIISGTSSANSDCKRLAINFIEQFYGKFPDLQKKAVKALFDNCADDNIVVRKQAVQKLQRMCTITPIILPHVSKMLTQILQTNDTKELEAVKENLHRLYEMKPFECIQSILTEIKTNDTDQMYLVRKRGLQVISDFIRTSNSKILTNEIEKFLLEELNIFLQDVNHEEFSLVIKLMRQFSSTTTLLGRKQLLKTIEEQAELDKEISSKGNEENDGENERNERIDIVLTCGKEAVMIVSKNAPSDLFSKKIECLRTLAQLTISYSFNCQERMLEYLKTFIDTFSRQLQLDKGDNTTELLLKIESNLDMSIVEPLIYLIHQFGKQRPKFLSEFQTNENEELFKKEYVDLFMKKVQWLCHCSKNLLKKLNSSNDELITRIVKENGNKMTGKEMISCSNNVTEICLDLLHRPPIYSAHCHFSWEKFDAGTKRTSTTVTTSRRKNRHMYNVR